MRRSHVSPRLAELVSTVERLLGIAIPSGVPVEGTPGDRGSSVGVGELEEFYRINEEEVTKLLLPFYHSHKTLNKQ